MTTLNLPSPQLRNFFASIAPLIAPLLVGVGLNFLLNSGSSGRGSAEGAMLVRFGAYAGEYMALAVWLAWGPGALRNRAAAVSLLGVAWMFASWAGYRASHPEHFKDFTSDRLQVFSVAPLSMLLGTLPLTALRKRYHFSVPSSSPGRTVILDTTSCLANILLVLVAAAAFYLRGRYAPWDLVTAILIATVLGISLFVVAPLFARGLLGTHVVPRTVLLAVFLTPVLGTLISLFLGDPGPGAAGATHPTRQLMTIALFSSLVCVGCFWYWRFAGYRIAPTASN